MRNAVNVRVQSEDFDVQAEMNALTANHPDTGAVVSFVGLCRSESGSLEALELEHYPGMAEAEITRIAEKAVENFGLIGITAVHRYGKIPVGDNIVLVVATSPHRQAAFDGGPCRPYCC